MNYKTKDRLIRLFFWLGYIAVCFVLVMVVLSLFGCASCEPTIVREEVVVKVPVEIKPEPLPVPDPVRCGPANHTDEEWRDSAQYIKDCFDTLAKKIEEYRHIIVSFNESLSD